MTCLRKIEGITRREKIINEEIREKIRMLSGNLQKKNETLPMVPWTRKQNACREISRDCTLWLSKRQKKQRKARKRQNDCKEMGLKLYETSEQRTNMVGDHLAMTQ